MLRLLLHRVRLWAIHSIPSPSPWLSHNATPPPNTKRCFSVLAGLTPSRDGELHLFLPSSTPHTQDYDACRSRGRRRNPDTSRTGRKKCRASNCC